MMETRMLHTLTVPAEEEAIRAAVELLAAGETVALPTETVYGLAADATRPDAVAKIFEAKERPLFDPLIVHLPDADWLGRLTETPAADRELVDKLAEAFWPGPLTLVLPRREIVPDIVTAGLETVAVRRSAHPVLKAVIERLGKPLAAPSANRFGRISPTTATHVARELTGRIPLIVDAGPTQHGVESTIVAVRQCVMVVLRPGPIAVEELEKFGRVETPEPTALPEAPGQFESHYAPRAPLRIVEDIAGLTVEGAQRIGLLAWNPEIGTEPFAHVEYLSLKQDLAEAAARLFACLRDLDEAGLDGIVAEPVPENGIGHAIMDRLRRAAR